jgi:hypothetical protein
MGQLVPLYNPGFVGEDCSIERFNLTLPSLLERVGGAVQADCSLTP